MKALLKWIKENVLYSIIILAFVSLTVIMLEVGGGLKTPNAPKGIVSLQLAPPIKTIHIISEWRGNSYNTTQSAHYYHCDCQCETPDCLIDAARMSTWIDFLYILAYVAFLGFLCTRSYAYNLTFKIKPKYCWWILGLAGLADAVENITILSILDGSQGDTLIWTKTAVAYVKFAALGFILITLLLRWLSHPNAKTLLRLIRFYFASLFFILIVLALFIVVAQGQDVLVMVGEEYYRPAGFYLSIFIWAYMTWYSNRLITYFKIYRDQGDECTSVSRFEEECRRKIPRMLGWLCFLMPQIAILSLPNTVLPAQSSALSKVIVLVVIIINLVLYDYFSREAKEAEVTRKTLIKWFGMMVGFTVVILIVEYAWRNYLSINPYDLSYYLQVLYLMIGGCFLARFSMVRRAYLSKEIIRSREEIFFWKVSFKVLSAMSRFMKEVLTKQEIYFYVIFNIVSLFLTLVYLAVIHIPAVANVFMASAVAIFSFSVILGFLNLITILNLNYRVNWTLLLVALLLILSNVGQPYKIRMTPKSYQSISNEPDLIAKYPYNQRSSIEEHLRSWFDQRKDLFLQDTTKTGKPIPLYFVMSDGGASRSAYWVVSALGKLTDQLATERFDDHIIAISGASGGSVGNVAYFSHLYNRKNGIERGPSSYEKALKDNIKRDFLTFTLARMIGPDFFGHLLPTHRLDRGTALESMLEYGDSLEIFSKDFSGFLSNKDYSPPLLFINTTRAQDGKPGVVSNIDVDSAIFNDRIDVLDLLVYDTMQYEIKMSTAAILSSRFPYVSPAANVQNQFFVDGGYFDNSGAGITQETMLWLDDNLERLKNEYGIEQNFEYYVIHHTNSPKVPTSPLTPINPLLNDLAAPILTLAGAYGQQTSLANLELQSYLADKYNDQDHWISVDLYPDSLQCDFPTYSFNWVTSEETLGRMDHRWNTIENQLIDDIRKLH